MSDTEKISNKNISLIITSIYVGLGTIYSLVYWTNNNPGFEGSGQFAFYFFSPVSFLSIALMFTMRESFLAILIGQGISFLIVWGPIHFVVFVIREIRSNNKKGKKTLKK